MSNDTHQDRQLQPSSSKTATAQKKSFLGYSCLVIDRPTDRLTDWQTRPPVIGGHPSAIRHRPSIGHRPSLIDHRPVVASEQSLFLEFSVALADSNQQQNGQNVGKMPLWGKDPGCAPKNNRRHGTMPPQAPTMPPTPTHNKHATPKPCHTSPAPVATLPVQSSPVLPSSPTRFRSRLLGPLASRVACPSSSWPQQRLSLAQRLEHQIGTSHPPCLAQFTWVCHRALPRIFLCSPQREISRAGACVSNALPLLQTQAAMCSHNRAPRNRIDAANKLPFFTPTLTSHFTPKLSSPKTFLTSNPGCSDLSLIFGSRPNPVGATTSFCSKTASSDCRQPA